MKEKEHTGQGNNSTINTPKTILVMFVHSTVAGLGWLGVVCGQNSCRLLWFGSVSFHMARESRFVGGSEAVNAFSLTLLIVFFAPHHTLQIFCFIFSDSPLGLCSHYTSWGERAGSCLD
jgi:hypothetical protein